MATREILTGVKQLAPSYQALQDSYRRLLPSQAGVPQEVYEQYERVYKLQQAGARPSRQQEAALEFWEAATDYIDLEEPEAAEGAVALASAVGPVDELWDEKKSPEELAELLGGDA